MNLSVSELITAISGIGVLLLLNALFVAAEFSLVKLRFTRFNAEAVEKAKRNRTISRLLSRMDRSLKVIRLGVATCTVGLGFVLAPLTLRFMGAHGEVLGSWETELGLLVAFLVAVALQFTVGELVPRALALQYPVQTLRLSTWPLNLFRFLSAPLLGLLTACSNQVLRVFRLDPEVDVNLIDVEAQIRALVSDGEEMPALAEQILHNTLDLRKRVAQDILLPRNKIQYFDIYDGNDVNLEIARKTGHTRFPLCEGDLDHCIGLIHIKDIFRSREDPRHLDLRKVRRDILRFSIDEPLENVLQRFLKQRNHFALLVDEFGGTVGAITLENVLEELVGDIQDEFDKEELLIKSLGDDLYQVDGLAPLHDLGETLGVEIDTEEVSTFGGYVTSELGKLPRVNESFRIGRLEIVVLQQNEKRIISAQVRLGPVEDDEEEDDRG